MVSTATQPVTTPGSMVHCFITRRRVVLPDKCEYDHLLFDCDKDLICLQNSSLICFNFPVNLIDKALLVGWQSTRHEVNSLEFRLRLGLGLGLGLC